VFVGNLNFDTTSEELRDLFAQVGEVVNVSIPTDRDNGRPRGFAFVEMSTDEQAAAAIEKFNGHELGGRALRVNEAGERPARPGGFGGGAARSGFGAGPPGPRSRPKGSRRNIRARKRSAW
jgi:cold-inducible RNA-binding protein